MKSVTPAQLNAAYMELNPGEIRPGQEPDSERILANWLHRYHQDPVFCVARSNWHGKVTDALLKALGLPKPKSKRHALFMLAGH
jgi:hypothetical protein